MRVATILTTPLLGHMPKSDYHMCLYQVIKDNAVYRNYYKQIAKEGRFLILDNGQAEGCSPTIEEMLPIYNDILPSEVVLPDIIGNKEETLKRTAHAYGVLTEAGYQEKFQFMGVAQGEFWSDWCDCVLELLQYAHITTIGVSKFVSKLFKNEFPEGTNIRWMCVQFILSAASDLARPVQIHLLGCWDDAKEIAEIGKTFGTRVRGTDSAIAYVYTRNGKSIRDGKRPDQAHIDFDLGNLEGHSSDLLRQNMMDWALMCNGR